MSTHRSGAGSFSASRGLPDTRPSAVLGICLNREDQAGVEMPKPKYLAYQNFVTSIQKKYLI